MASSMQADPTHNGAAIPAWTETAKEYLVLEKFPNLRNRLKNGLDCLEEEERVSLGTLIQERRTEQKTTNHKPLHHKVSLLAGGNLAHVAADAVVNASNHWLGTGKGVAGALHSAAGPCLLEECLSLGGCAVGEAKLSSGYNLPAKQVLHTVGPEGKDKDRKTLLRSCYESCLSLCVKHNIRTVAFPCISTGAYRYPCVEAADVALSTVHQWLNSDDNEDKIDRIVFVTRTARDEEAYGFLMLVYFPI